MPSCGFDQSQTMLRKQSRRGSRMSDFGEPLASNFRIEFRERRLLNCDMTTVLPDTIRRLCTDPGEYIDSDHPARCS